MGNPNALIGPSGVWSAPNPATRVDALRFGDVFVEISAGLAKAWIAFQAILLTTVLLGQLSFGGPALVITGRSMMPTLPPGSVVLTRNGASAETSIGSIVSFDVDGHTVTHRVVDREGNVLTTRGDANSSADTSTLPTDSVIATTQLVVPFVGLPRLWFDRQQWLPLGAWLTTVAGALVMISIASRRGRALLRRPKARLKNRQPRTDRLVDYPIASLPPTPR